MDTDDISCDTFFNNIYTYTLRDVDALNESPVHYLEKNLIPPFLPQLYIDNFMTSSFDNVTLCLSPLITGMGQTFDYHSNNGFHCKRLKSMHCMLDHGLI